MTQYAYQRWLTVLFVLGYFALLFTFIGLGVALFVYDGGHHGISEEGTEILKWIMATLGPLLGLLTGSLKEQLSHHYEGPAEKNKPVG